MHCVLGLHDKGWLPWLAYACLPARASLQLKGLLCQCEVGRTIQPPAVVCRQDGNMCIATCMACMHPVKVACACSTHCAFCTTVGCSYSTSGCNAGVRRGRWGGGWGGGVVDLAWMPGDLSHTQSRSALEEVWVYCNSFDAGHSIGCPAARRPALSKVDQEESYMVFILTSTSTPSSEDGAKLRTSSRQQQEQQ